MKELATALAKAQAKIGAAAKSSTNPHFKSKYADLSEVWDAWQKVGPECGLSLAQTLKFADGHQFLVTTLLHTSGESMTSEMLLTPTKNDMQGMGSAITYARRYCMAAMVGIVQDDDDANAASSGERTPANNGHRTAAPKQPEDPAVAKSREDFSRIMEALNLAKKPEEIDRVIAAQGKTLAEIKAVSQTGYEKLMAHAEDRKANMLQQAA
jgi:hypothetical protein